MRLSPEQAQHLQLVLGRFRSDLKEGVEGFTSEVARRGWWISESKTLNVYFAERLRLQGRPFVFARPHGRKRRKQLCDISMEWDHTGMVLPEYRLDELIAIFRRASADARLWLPTRTAKRLAADNVRLQPDSEFCGAEAVMRVALDFVTDYLEVSFDGLECEAPSESSLTADA
jgi:hypothetical protein